MSSDERAPLLDSERGAPRPVGWRSHRGFGLAVATTLAAFAAVAVLASPPRSARLGTVSDLLDLPNNPDPPSIFDTAPELRAPAARSPDGVLLTVPWQPVSLGATSVASSSDDRSGPVHPVGVVAGHGLHCGMESMAHLLADVHPDIPTAVYGARASDPGDTKTTAGADSWLAGVVADAETSRAPVEDALRDRVGFRAQSTDFESVADAARYERVVLVGESMSTGAALWAAVDGARSDADDRVAGVVLTLVPTMGEERRERFGDIVDTIRRTFESFDSSGNVTMEEVLTRRLDCSVGYGCVPFGAFVAAKHSDLPSLKEISEARGRFPVLVLADRDAEPAHPVENGRAVAEALGAEFHVAANGAERRRTWPRLVADFVRKIADARGVGLSVETDETDETGDCYDDADPSLLLTPEQLRRSSLMCVGMPEATPRLARLCASRGEEEEEGEEKEGGGGEGEGGGGGGGEEGGGGERREGERRRPRRRPRRGRGHLLGLLPSNGAARGGVRGGGHRVATGRRDARGERRRPIPPAVTVVCE